MGHNSETPCGLATKHGVSERTSMHSVMDEAACRKLREWRDLSREGSRRARRVRRGTPRCALEWKLDHLASDVAEVLVDMLEGES
jgi:hypothetical protein